MLPASYSVPQSGCATPLVPDGLMVSSTSAIYSENPSPGSPRAGAASILPARGGLGWAPFNAYVRRDGFGVADLDHAHGQAVQTS
jgi:hypothetical protein